MKCIRPISRTLLALLCCLFFAAPAGAEEIPFIRIDKQDATARALQVALARFSDPKDSDVQVDLVSAVHVGDKSYYEELNSIFEGYDAVLFELVGPEAKVRKNRVADDPSTRASSSEGNVAKENGAGEKSDSQASAELQAQLAPVSGMQAALKNFLRLSYQLEEVDYTPEHFVHADMTAEQFSQAMADDGNSFWSLMFKIMLESYAEEKKNPQLGGELKMLYALLHPDKAYSMKLLLAEQFADLKKFKSMFAKGSGDVLIRQRNDRALEVLRRELDSGKKKIAIFYGAAHMPDFAKKIIADFGMRYQSTVWLDAWNLQDPNAR